MIVSEAYRIKILTAVSVVQVSIFCGYITIIIGRQQTRLVLDCNSSCLLLDQMTI